MSKTFVQGWAAPPFKDQFPELCDRDAERLDSINAAITTLLMEDMLTDSVYATLRQKKFPKVVSNVLASKRQP